MRLRFYLRRFGVLAPIAAATVLFSRLKLGSRIRILISATSAKIVGGKEISFGRDVCITPGALIKIGASVYIGDRCVFEVRPDESVELEIGDGTWISHDTHIQANGTLRIGKHVLIGEFVSIRDTTHDAALHDGSTFKHAKDVSGKIEIRDNVWIGRGALVIANGRELIIEQGAIVAANSVLTRSLPKNTIWFGSSFKTPFQERR